MKIKASPPILKVLISIAVVVQSTAWGDGLPTAKPKDVGLSQERLDRITAAMEEDVEKGELRGALAMVARNGKVAYLETSGMADTESEVPMREDTIFRIYSMSKPITSVAVMTLFEEGRFFLNDPVSKYIPEFAGMSVIVEGESESNQWPHRMDYDAILGFSPPKFFVLCVRRPS